MTKKIGIIGGAGFLGSRLAERLKSTNAIYEIFDIDDENINTIKVDVRDLSSLSKLSECDVLINLAAVHRDDVKPTSLYDDVNVLGAKNICLIARRYNIKKIIFTSSVAVYGLSDENFPRTENNYFNDYGRTSILLNKCLKIGLMKIQRIECCLLFSSGNFWRVTEGMYIIYLIKSHVVNL